MTIETNNTNTISPRSSFIIKLLRYAALLFLLFLSGVSSLYGPTCFVLCCVLCFLVGWLVIGSLPSYVIKIKSDRVVFCDVFTREVMFTELKEIKFKKNYRYHDIRMFFMTKKTPWYVFVSPIFIIANDYSKKDIRTLLNKIRAINPNVMIGKKYGY